MSTGAAAAAAAIAQAAKASGVTMDSVAVILVEISVTAFLQIFAVFTTGRDQASSGQRKSGRLFQFQNWLPLTTTGCIAFSSQPGCPWPPLIVMMPPVCCGISACHHNRMD